MRSQVFKARDNYKEINKLGIIHVSPIFTTYICHTALFLQGRECLALDKNGCHTMELETLSSAAPIEEHYFNFYLRLQRKCLHKGLHL